MEVEIEFTVFFVCVFCLRFLFVVLLLLSSFSAVAVVVVTVVVAVLGLLDFNMGFAVFAWVGFRA